MDDAQAFVDAFASPATYVAEGVPTQILAVVDDAGVWSGLNTELRDTYNRGQVRLGNAWLSASALPVTPAFGHVLEQGGRAWTVEDAWAEGDMVVLGLSQGVMATDVVVQTLMDVPDGALGFDRQWVDSMTCKACVLALGGKERVQAAREVGVGYRHGWMPACSALAVGCRLVTAHEILHVTSASTDHVRGFSLFEAEVREEEQP